MKTRSIRMLSLSLVAALAICAIFAGTAAAVPAWKFSGKALEGSEVTVGFGVETDLNMFAPIQCEHFLYKMTISNKVGTGEGEVTELPLFNCTTTAEGCTVETIEAEELPWPAHLVTVGKSNYLDIKEIAIGIVFGGETCAIGEVLIPVTGSAGGLFDNVTEAAIFDELSFEKTGTALEAFGSPVQLEGAFPTEAFQWHREQVLSVS